MTKQEVMKLLYKENPLAYFVRATKDGLWYTATVTTGELEFMVPLNEIGDTVFEKTMEGKLWSRYAVLTEVKIEDEKVKIYTKDNVLLAAQG